MASRKPALTMLAAITAAIATTAMHVSAHAETALQRGEYLVRGPAGCGNCHTPIGPTGPVMELELTGRVVEKNDMFTAVAPNLTPAGPIAGWSDAELSRAIREGIRPDGSVIGPPMPIALYRGLSDSDLAAMVAFLRSLPAKGGEALPPSEYNIPLPPTYGPPVDTVADVPRGPTAEYGAYLAGPVAHCLECHSPMGPRGPMLDKPGQGGMAFHGPWGTAVASNITSHEDGLKSYSDDEIKAMIVKGVRPDGTQMFPPMPYSYLAAMTDDDLTAIVAYLRTVPPLPDAD